MVQFRGFPACMCLVEWLPQYEAALLRAGVIKHSLDIYQLKGNAVAASAGTHAGGGAFDTGQYSTKALQIAREMGAATWHRTPAQGFIHHSHGILKGCTHASVGAKRQVVELESGGDGLVGNRKDDGPAPRKLRTWREGIAWAKAQAVPPLPKPTTRPEDWFSHTEWNLAGFDTVGGGKDSFAKRIPEIVAEIKAIDSDVYSLLEIPKTHVPAMTKALAKIGYKFVVWYEGRAVVARSQMKTGRTAKYDIPEKGIANDSRFSVFAEVFPTGKHTALIGAGHFEHRVGAAHDLTRVTQAKQNKAKGLRLAESWGIHISRVFFADDENSGAWVLDRAYESDFRDSFEGAWQSVNEKVATIPGWSGKTPNGERRDKIKRHKTRPVRRSHVRKAAAGISDHLPVTVVYGSTS